MIRPTRALSLMVLSAASCGGHTYPHLQVQSVCGSVVSREVFIGPGDVEGRPSVSVTRGVPFLLVFDRSCQGAAVSPAPSSVFAVQQQVRRHGALVAGVYGSDRDQVVHFVVTLHSGSSYSTVVTVRG
jgi:hypothetical protein